MTNFSSAIGEVLGAVGDTLSTSPNAPAKAAGHISGVIATSFGTLGSVWDNEGYAGAAKVVAGGLGCTAVLTTIFLSS